MDILDALYALIHRFDLVLPSELVITSGSEGGPQDHVHAPSSRHYTGEAIDIRTHNFPSRLAATEFYSALKRQLGHDFTVLFEFPGAPSEHIHVQPAKGTIYPS
jgi:hypothetical protein